MTTLYIDHKNAALEVEGATLVARLGEVRQRPVPLALLERVVCLANVQLDTSVLGTLAEHGIAFSVASQRKPQRRAVLLGSGHNDASIRLLHYRLAQDSAWRLAFTRQVLAAKFAAHLRLHGLEPLLGVYHETSFGWESLASDLIEVWRSHIDAWVWECFRTQTLREHHFKTDVNGCFLDKAGRQVFFASLETRLRPLGRAMRWRCMGLVTISSCR